MFFTKYLMLGAFALALGSSASFANEKSNELYILNWSDYISPKTIANFEKETNIKVHYQLLDSNEILEAKMMAGSSGFDIIPPSLHILKRLSELNLLEPLDKNKLPNFKNLDKKKLEKIAKVDTNNTYGIPYMELSTGIGYNVDAVKKIMGDDFVVDSFDILFKDDIASKLKQCGITVLDSPSDMLCSTLIYLGLDPESTDKNDYIKARDILIPAMKNVRYMHSSQYINDLASGEVCVSIGWSGDVQLAAQRAKEANLSKISYIIPKEGALTGYDMLAIPKDAKNKDNAYLFLDYILRPEVIAEITNYIRYANANKEATKYVSKDIALDKGIYYDDNTLDRMHIVIPQNKVVKLITRTWNDVRIHSSDE